MFIIHRFITDPSRGRVDASGAERSNISGAWPLFSRITNAALMKFFAFTHRSRSRSRVITSGGSSPGGPWPSVTVTEDKSFSSRTFNSEVVFCSKDSASLYATLNFRGPNEHPVLMITVKMRKVVRGRTLNDSGILRRNACTFGPQPYRSLPKVMWGTHARGRRRSDGRRAPSKHLLPVVGAAS